MKKPLPRVKVGAERYEFIRATCAGLLAACRCEATDGTVIFAGAAGRPEVGMSTRDLGYLAEYGGGLVAPEEVLGALDYVLVRQREDGVLPDRVYLDGTAVYHAGEQPDLGEPLDNAPYAVKTMFAYLKATGRHAALTTRRNAFYRAMDAVPLTDDGLVLVDPNRPHAGYGYSSQALLTGKHLFCSLLFWEACATLAQMLRRAEEHDEAHEWYEAAEQTGKPLTQFYDPTYGVFRAASESCNQIDLWASVYACVNRAASKGQADRVASFLLTCKDLCFYRGHLRHLPGPEFWQRLFVPVPRWTGQNGAFWAVPTGWGVQTINLVDESAAVALVDEVIEQWRERGVFACIEARSEPQQPGHLASAVNLLGACAP